MPAPKTTRSRVVIGIDPSNESTGWAVFRNGEYYTSDSFNPWTHRVGLNWAQGEEGCRVYAEKPRAAMRGKSATDGINAARGMVLGYLLESEAITSRRQVKTVYPDQWRAAIFGKGVQRDRAGWKKLAIKKASALAGRPIESDDEAEAILIAQYGWLKWEEERDRGRRRRSKESQGPRASRPRAKRGGGKDPDDHREPIQRRRGG